MSPDDLTADEQELIRRAAEAVMRLRTVVLDVAGVYVRLDPDERGLDQDARGLAAGQVELVAELWRDAELLGSWEIEREVGWEGPGEVLGALQDSLLLALSSHPERRAEVLPVGEAVERLEALEAEGAFEGLERTGVGPPAPDGSPPDDRQLVERFDALADDAIVTCSETFTFYGQFAPDGGAPDARAVEALECLEAAASCQRALDADRELIARFAARRDLAPTRAILRAMQNGLVLALSEDPARRAKAMPVEELQRRMRPVYEGLKVPTESGG